MMKTMGRIVLATLTLSWALACDTSSGPGLEDDPGASSVFRAGLHHPGVFEGPAPLNLARVRWTFQTDGTVRGTPAVAGDRIYVGSGDGHLYALDRHTGAELWRFDAGSPVPSVPTVETGRVFFTTRAGSVIAVSAASGELIWRVETGELIPFVWGGEGWDYWTGSVTVVGDRVVFGAGDGVVYAADAATGSPIWQFQTEGRVRATPAVHEGRVLIGSFDGRLYALDLADGSEDWTFATEGASLDSSEFGFDRRSIQSSVAVVGGVVYLGARDANLYAVDLVSGEELWRTNDDTAWVISSPAVTDGVVYSATSSSAIAHAVDAGSGEELWRTSVAGPVFGSPAVVGETVVITDFAGFVSVLDRASGELLWRFRTGDAIRSSPVVVDGTVYVGSDDGRVYALESGPDPTPMRAVYYDEDLSDFTTLARSEAIMGYFRRRGYDVLGAPALADFMEGRTQDGTKSVVVFAQDWIPAEVASDGKSDSLFRRYLEGGGKVVWLGYPPMAIGRDPETGEFTDYDESRAAAFLDVAHNGAGDDYGVRVTEEGRAWGLPSWWTALGGIDPAGVTRVLGLDENGRAAAWVKEYGGEWGTGFVYLRGRLAETDLEAVGRAAEYGIIR